MTDDTATQPTVDSDRPWEHPPLPLSKFAEGMGTFRSRLAYTDMSPERAQRRYEGDHLLCGRLGEALGRGDGRVGDLDEHTLSRIVEDVEERFFERGWRLSGDETQPTSARLDAHFAGPQAAWVAHRRGVQEHADLLARERAEQRLDELRAAIVMERAAIAHAEERIVAMERELAVGKLALGVPA